MYLEMPLDQAQKTSFGECAGSSDGMLCPFGLTQKRSFDCPLIAVETTIDLISLHICARRDPSVSVKDHSHSL